MEQLIIEMLIFIFVAFVLGIILGWLLTRKSNNKTVENASKTEKNDKNSGNRSKISDGNRENLNKDPVIGSSDSKIDKESNLKVSEVSYSSADKISKKTDLKAPATDEKEAQKEQVKQIEEGVTQTNANGSENSTDSQIIAFNGANIESDVDLEGKGYGIQHVEGIGPKTGDSLRALGINKVGHLLNITMTPEQRASLASQLNLKVEYIEKWASMCDFLRIKGVDHQSSELINVSGPRNMEEFSQQNAEEFVTKMKNLNEAKSKLIAPEVPNVQSVQSWIDQAKGLKNVVVF